MDPSHTVFCNLWGWQTKREEKTTSTENKETITTFPVPVEEYVQKFQELYHPGFWSYDMYPIGYEFDVNDKNYQTLHNFIGDEGQKEGNWYKDFINSKINSGAMKPSFEVRMDLYERLKACPGKLKTNNRAFYWDLELYSRMSYITGRPFYAFCETMAYWNFDQSPDKHPYMRPRPTINFLRFEAFSALAYGANGIVFWTYCMRVQRTIKTAAKDESATYEILLAAIADANGKIERLADFPSHGDKLAPDTYDVVSQLNAEIKKYEYVFKDATLIKAVHRFDSDKPLLQDQNIPGLSYAKNLGPLVNIYITSVTSSSEINGMQIEMNYDYNGVLMTQLANKGRNYLVIVNHDPFNIKRLQLSFQYQGRLIELTPYYNNETYLDSQPKEIISDDNTSVVRISRTLEAGSYLIYEYY